MDNCKNKKNNNKVNLDKNKNIHAGHFARIREKFLKYPSSFDDRMLVEVLLTFSKYKSDVNPLSHILMDNKFNTFEDLLNAVSVNEKQGTTNNNIIWLKENGVTDNTIELIRELPKIVKCYQNSLSEMSFYNKLSLANNNIKAKSIIKNNVIEDAKLLKRNEYLVVAVTTARDMVAYTKVTYKDVKESIEFNYIYDFLTSLKIRTAIVVVRDDKKFPLLEEDGSLYKYNEDYLNDINVNFNKINIDLLDILIMKNSGDEIISLKEIREKERNNINRIENEFYYYYTDAESIYENMTTNYQSVFKQINLEKYVLNFKGMMQFIPCDDRVDAKHIFLENIREKEDIYYCNKIPGFLKNFKPKVSINNQYDMELEYAYSVAKNLKELSDLEIDENFEFTKNKIIDYKELIRNMEENSKFRLYKNIDNCKNKNSNKK